MQVKLISHTPDPEGAIARAAANCWQSVSHVGILEHIIKSGHWTPLEFATFNFEISGVSRALTHQLVRKRVGVAFAQESQRYCAYEDGFDYVVPPSIRAGKHQRAATVQHVFDHAMHTLLISYRNLLRWGVPAEDARYILPNACNSSIHMSINYHALLDLAKERLCSRAQWEIRELIKKVREEVARVSPRLAGYMQPKCYWLGRCPEKNSCGKVRFKEADKG